MRIGNSPLKAHLSNILHVIESPLCPCGTGEEENPKHFFFTCTLFDRQREQLNQNLLPFIITENEITHLLYGIPHADHSINLHVYGAVHQYIRDTKRFYWAPLTTRTISPIKFYLYYVKFCLNKRINDSVTRGRLYRGCLFAQL